GRLERNYSRLSPHGFLIYGNPLLNRAIEATNPLLQSWKRNPVRFECVNGSKPSSCLLHEVGDRIAVECAAVDKRFILSKCEQSREIVPAGDRPANTAEVRPAPEFKLS